MEVEIMNDVAMKRSLTRISYEIIEKNKGSQDLVLVGIKTRGIHLAKQIQKNIEKIEEVLIPCYELDISNYRDDVEIHEPLLNDNLPFKNKKVIIVDDVLYNGRTARAAMDAIMRNGRANEIQLAVLIDRGHRKLPIRADYIGKNVPTSLEEQIKVKVMQVDNENSVYLIKP